MWQWTRLVDGILVMQVMKAPCLSFLEMSDNFPHEVEENSSFPFGTCHQLQSLKLRGTCWRFHLHNISATLTKLVLKFELRRYPLQSILLEDLTALNCLTDLRKLRLSRARSALTHIMENFKSLRRYFPHQMTYFKGTFWLLQTAIDLCDDWLACCVRYFVCSLADCERHDCDAVYS